MATLEKIRSKAGLLVVVIGVALMAFVLGDILTGNKTMFSGSSFDIADVDGTPLSVQSYQERLDEVFRVYEMNRGKIDEQTSESLREQTWNDFIQEAVMVQEYEALGMEISDAELQDMVQGDNIHPIIAQVFGDPNTGEVNRDGIRGFVAGLDGQYKDQKPFWLYIEKEVISKKKLSKFNNLVNKAVYVTKNQAEMVMNEKSPEVNFSFLVKKYADVADSTVSVSDSELQSYYNEHKHEYKQEAERDLDYVAFDVVASQEDNLDAQKWINDMAADFIATDKDAQFVSMNSDAPLDEKFYKAGELPTRLDTVMFAQEVGYVYGPYFENQTYKLSKLSEVMDLPDSVLASHILIKYDQNDRDGYVAARAKLDSLKLLVEEGTAKFDELAKVHSVDGSAPSGGDLGWFKEGQMVKPFNDACFFGQEGDLTIVDSQFGSHLIWVNKHGEKVQKVRVATVERLVQPSDATYQKFYSQANEFAGKNTTADLFITAAEAKGKRKVTVTENQRQIPGMESPRSLVRWAYEANVGDVSQVFEFGNRYIIATVSDVREKGIATLEQRKAIVEAAVVKEKKGDKLVAEVNELLAAGKSLKDAAAAIGGTLETAEAINFAAFQLPGFGIEHKVIAEAVALNEGDVSKAIAGQNGVYVLQVTSKKEIPAGDVLTEKTRLESGVKNRVEREVYPALKELANVEDMRSKFE